MSGLLPPNILSYTGQVVVPFMRETFDPNSHNYQFNVPTIWINTNTQKAWILVAKPMNVAVWLEFAGGAGDIISLTGNSGGAVFPTAGNINVVGDGVNTTTVGNPGTSTITVELLGDVATLYTEDSGTAVPSGGNLNIFGINGISTSGAGSTVTINGAGTMSKLDVDAHTAPGTDPVVPNGSGQITLTGAQVAAGTTSNVIRTDSLAANTCTIEIQRSQAVASSTIGDNGVSHYNSVQFSVDANGFVTLAGSGGGAPILGVTVDAHTAPGTSPVVPNSAGNIIVTGGQVAAGTTSNVIRTDSLAANTYTVEIQRSQAVASTTVGDNGVCHFNSTQFSVDANGFVSFLGATTFAWNDVSGAFSPLKNNGYFITGTATGTLPASPAQGDTIKFFVDTANALTIQASGSQIIRLGSLASTAGGTATSTLQGDCVTLVYRTSDTCWCAVDAVNGVWIMA